MTSAFEIPAEQGDDIGFIQELRNELTKEAVTTNELWIVKVDHWFGENWLEFAAKVMGAFGVWSLDLCVPPFHPSRIVSERWLVRANTSFEEHEPSLKLHVRQASEENKKRKLATISSSATFLWYSGDSVKTGRGSLMKYVTNGNDQDAWYVEIIKRAKVWRTAKRREGFGLDRQPPV